MSKKTRNALKEVKPEMAIVTESEESTEPVDREEMIAIAAFLRAEQRGFQGGDPVADWLDAETAIDTANTLST